VNPYGRGLLPALAQMAPNELIQHIWRGKSILLSFLEADCQASSQTMGAKESS